MSNKQNCLWCNREIKEEEKEDMIDCGNEEVGSQPHHGNCFERAKDKTGQ